MMHKKEQAARMIRTTFKAKLTESVTYKDFSGAIWTQCAGTEVDVTFRDYEDSESLDESGLCEDRPGRRFIATVGEDHFVVRPAQFLTYTD